MDDEERAARIRGLFDTISVDYDQSGVEFFGPIARGLVDLLELRPGERVLDVGCGRGAVAFAAAEAVGPTGRITAVDIAPGMVALTRQGAAELGLDNVETAVIAPDHLDVPDRSSDVVASSLVLFFASDPLGTLRLWTRPLVPGGRLGISSFGDPDPVWRDIDGLFRPYLPADLLDARTTGASGPFVSDDGVERLLTEAGLSEVRTVHRRLEVGFEDADQWRLFSMSTGQRAFWGFVPAPQRADVFAQAEQLLEKARRPDGEICLVQDVRYTWGRAPSTWS